MALGLCVVGSRDRDLEGTRRLHLLARKEAGRSTDARGPRGAGRAFHADGGTRLHRRGRGCRVGYSAHVARAGGFGQTGSRTRETEGPRQSVTVQKDTPTQGTPTPREPPAGARARGKAEPHKGTALPRAG